MKEINFSPRAKLKKGLDIVADSVKVTIGPKGKNVVIERGYEPLITNDGGTIAAEIQLTDRIENMGAQLIKGVIRKTSEKVGGGRTASAILTQAIVTEGLKQVENGMNMLSFKQGMEEAVADVTENLKANSREVKNPSEIKQVATISTESEELGAVISHVINKVGKDCVVTVEESQSLGITSEVVDGLKFDKGFISQFMVSNPERMEAELKDVPVLVTDKKISFLKDILPIIKGLAEGGINRLLIICEDMDGEALSAVVAMKIQGQFNVLAVKAPGFQDKFEWLDDIALLTGTQVVTDRTQITFDAIQLGKAKKVVSKKDNTILIGSDNILQRVSELEGQVAVAENPWEEDKLKQRIARLRGSVAVIKVGAATESELKYLKQKIEDGVNESKRALEEGIVIGGDCAFVQALKSLKVKKGVDERSLGYNTVLRAIEAPLRQIVLNANGKPDVVVNDLLQTEEATAGFNALTNIVEKDMFKAGIIDALKVARTTLENALSGASMFLTIECSISNEPEDNKQQRQQLEY